MKKKLQDFVPSNISFNLFTTSATIITKVSAVWNRSIEQLEIEIEIPIANKKHLLCKS